MSLLPVALGVPSAAAVGTVGYSGPGYSGVTAPTGEKPQSKLWIADGIWWGSLWNASTKDFEIHRYDLRTHTWTTTGTLTDERASADMDALWDGEHLYIATAGTSATDSNHAARIVRFTYDPVTKSYARDAGFPVTITNGGVPSIVLAKDSTGTLWVTWTASNRVWVAHSTSSEATWTAPSGLPVVGATGIGPAEISSVVAYDGDRIGVMWSNQPENSMLFASHVDGAADTAWTVEAAYARPEGADDHLNLKTLTADSSGRVFAAVKTSLNGATDPLIHLLVLAPDGTWSSHPFGTVADNHTRAIVLIDEENRDLYMFAASPCCSGGTIYMKSTSLDSIAFESGLGTAFISNSAAPEANNPTSTKQNLNGSTDLVVLAGDDQTRTYLHNSLDLAAAGPDLTPPSVTATLPEDGTVGASPVHAVSVDFDERLDPDTVVAATARLERQADGTAVPATVALDASGSRVVIDPVGELEELTSYAATIVGGPGGVTDLAGNPLPADHIWSFTTGSQLVADDFESGDLSRWVVTTNGSGTAAVVAGEGVGGSQAAHLASRETKGSYSYLRASLATSAEDVTTSLLVRYDGEGTGGSPPFLRLLDAAGNRLVSLLRSNSSDRLQIQYGGQTINSSVRLHLGDPYREITLHITVVAPGTDSIELLVDGVLVYQTTAASLGAPVGMLQLGNDQRQQGWATYFDDVSLRPGGPT